MRGKLVDLIGRKFGRLTVVKKVENPKKYTCLDAFWLCKCRCGNLRIINGSSLRKGASKSCGCRRKEMAAQWGKERGKTLGKKYGFIYGKLKKIHGHSHSLKRKGASKEYQTWQSMKDRCLNFHCSGYKNYGGRGINVYKPWIHSFETFLQYLKDNNMYPKPKNMSIDRFPNNDGNYEPGNIRWATPSQQEHNKRFRKSN
jgi:hypothetical protein